MCVCVVSWRDFLVLFFSFFGILAVFAVSAADVFDIVSRKREGGKSSEKKATEGELDPFFFSEVALVP